MRWGYALAALVLFAVEVVIALFVRDAFVRPYLGDVLAVMLVYAVLRAVTPLEQCRRCARRWGSHLSSRSRRRSICLACWDLRTMSSRASCWAGRSKYVGHGGLCRWRGRSPCGRGRTAARRERARALKVAYHVILHLLGVGCVAACIAIVATMGALDIHWTGWIAVAFRTARGGDRPGMVSMARETNACPAEGLLSDVRTGAHRVRFQEG